MGKYELVVRKSVLKDVRTIPKKDVKRILRRIESLRTEPRPSGCEKLSGQERYRLRQGTYRILYEISDTKLIVTVVKIGHRKNVYD
jgi:mRNA interferase RelE/StbE